MIHSGKFKAQHIYGMPKQMVLGSAKMILESNEHPMALVDQVCSPGGTTIQGVTSLQANRFEGVIHDAVTAVTKKITAYNKTFHRSRYFLSAND